MIYLTGIIISLFLCSVLLGKKNKNQADWLLFAWLLTIASNLIFFVLQIDEAIYQYPRLLGWAFSFPLLHYTFLYLYVQALTKPRAYNPALLLHFMPFVLSIALFSNYLFLPSALKIAIYENKGKGYETQILINLVAIVLSGLIYTSLSVIRLWQYKKRIKDEFSYSEKINLNWLSFLIAGMILIFLIIVLGANDTIIFASVVGFVLFMGYFGIKQVGIFTNPSLLLAENKAVFPEVTVTNASVDLTENGKGETGSVEDQAGKKYLKSSLQQSAAEELYKDLKNMMLSQKLFKNPELSLDDLAGALKVLPNHLSQVINSFEDKNFYDYINQLRVNEFKDLVSKPENQKFTLLSLAFECGFNSKTSFNRNFKKATGVTPSDYLKQIASS